MSYALEKDKTVFINQRVLHDMTAGHNANPEEELATYVKYDLGYSQQFSPQLKAIVTLKNVTDRELWVPNVANGPKGITEDPRTLLLTVSYDF